jgi:hypothetical protein
MGKNIAAGIAGVLIAIGLVWIVEMTGHTIYPPPPEIDFSDADAMTVYLSDLPIGAFLFVGGAWFIGTFGGTVAAVRIGNAKPRVFALIVGGFMLLATTVNLVMIPHPLWFSICAVAGIVIAARLGMLAGATAEQDVHS